MFLFLLQLMGGLEAAELLRINLSQNKFKVSPTHHDLQTLFSYVLYLSIPEEGSARGCEEIAELWRERLLDPQHCICSG